MATEREQLIETRKAIIEKELAGKSESVKTRALRDIDRMNFADHADFLSYVAECAGTTPDNDNHAEPETDQDKLDEVMSHLFPEQGHYSKPYKPKAGEASEAAVDEVFKHMRW